MKQLDSKLLSLRKSALERADYLLTCSNIPREIFDAFGLISIRLAPEGRASVETKGETQLGEDACSWCKGCVGGIAGSLKGKAQVVSCTSCDQTRRSYTVRTIKGGATPYILNTPATRSDNARGYFRDSLERLFKTLIERHGSVSGDALKSAIKKRNDIRKRLSQLRAVISPSQFLTLIHLDFLSTADEMLDTLSVAFPVYSSATTKPLLLLGSPSSFEERWLFDYLENIGAPIVADATCTGDRAVNFRVELTDSPIENLADAFFDRPPCAWVRPNDEFYNYARSLACERKVAGVVLKTVRYCDVWSFEEKRVREKLGLPLLHIDTTYGDIHSPRIQTRLEAFVESLA